MLKIQKYIRTYGLEKTVKDFNLISKDYGHKILLKYSQIESIFSYQEVRECRGLILEKETWDVMSLAFFKFFNLGEGHAAPINWSTARIFKKLDGSLIHFYWDPIKKDVFFGTTGTAEGEGDVDTFHHNLNGGTFSDLFVSAFIETVNSNSLPPDFDHRDKVLLVKTMFIPYSGYTLAFELTTKYNIVVTPHTDSRVYLLGGRDLATLRELNNSELDDIASKLKVPRAPSYDLKNPDEILRTFESMPWMDEGYVACDSNFNRVKIKNPAYLAVHYLKDETAFWRVIDIVRSGELDEFAVTFPHRKEELDDLDAAWKKLQASMRALKDVISESEEYKSYIGTDAYEKYTTIRANWEKIKSGLTEDEVKLVKTGGYDEYNRFTSALKDNGGIHRKNIAVKIQQLCMNKDLKRFSGYFFSFLNEPELQISDYLRAYDGKDLYQILTNKPWRSLK